MISREDIEIVRKILEHSELWESIEEVTSWFDEPDSDTKFDNIIKVKLGKRTEKSGGEQNQISIDATIPLMKEQMIIVDCSLEYLLIKKIKPILRWDLVE